MVQTDVLEWLAWSRAYIIAFGTLCCQGCCLDLNQVGFCVAVTGSQTADSYKQVWKDGLLVHTQTGDKECRGAVLQVPLRTQQPEEWTLP